MVPPNWEHPTVPGSGLQPMLDTHYERAAKEWRDGLAAWEGGEREAHRLETGEDYEYWEWTSNPPSKEYYRPWRDEEATWFQVWETVTEGTPVTPPFATREELAAYLAEYGDEWDQSRGHGGWGMKRAQAFVASGWAPSGAIFDGRWLESKDVPLALEESK